MYDGSVWRQNYLNTASAQASTSGTSIDFGSIPSWVKRITLMLASVSTNGTSNPLVQIGTGGTPTTSGYLCGASNTPNSTPVATNFTTGFGIYAGSATNVIHGIMTLTLVSASSNTWVAAFTGGVSSSSNSLVSGGSVSLSGTLNFVRLTTVNGTDAYDAGTVNILYE
jgi:hypothetical protein